MADDAELRIYGEIGPEYFGMISDVAVIRALDELSGSRKISVRINSPGGDAFMGVSIMNAFKRHPAKVLIHIDAIAASAASIIAMGGDRIIMHEGSLMMLHRAWTIAMGNAEDMAKVAEVLGKVDDNLRDVYARKSGLDKAKVKSMLDAETWLTATEAVELGLADETDTAPTGAKACLPEGWYHRAPDIVSRYSLSNRKVAALTGLSICAKAPPQDNSELAERRRQLERIKSRLSAA